MKTRLDSPPGQRPFEASLARERAKERDTSSDLWTLAVTSALVERLPRQPLLEIGPIRDGAAVAADADASGETAGEAELRGDRYRADGSEGARADAEDAARARSVSGASALDETPSELHAEVSDERLGRLHLHVARTDGGLDIVISVADPRVKALIEAEQGILMKTLKDAGLHVSSVQIGSPSRAGTALAVDRSSSEKTRATASFRQLGRRRRSYDNSLEEDDTDSEGQGFDFTA